MQWFYLELFFSRDLTRVRCNSSWSPFSDWVARVHMDNFLFSSSLSSSSTPKVDIGRTTEKFRYRLRLKFNVSQSQMQFSCRFLQKYRAYKMVFVFFSFLFRPQGVGCDLEMQSLEVSILTIANTALICLVTKPGIRPIRSSRSVYLLITTLPWCDCLSLELS